MGAMKILITGGTVFVSRYMAEFFVREGCEVYVLNRGSREQSEGVTLIEADRHDLGDRLRDVHFDAVVDVTAYNDRDVNDLLDALDSFDDYILISSSAVYPETGRQPFAETAPVGENGIWGKYGTDKIAAEEALMSRFPRGYAIRPPYLYGPMNNVYREAFVFECALNDRKFYLPEDGSMRLQFFHVDDLCRMVMQIITTHPEEHIFNAGNTQTVTVREWVELCYAVAGKTPEFVEVADGTEQRRFFSFYNYEYCLDVSRQSRLLPSLKPLEEGLRESYEWYLANAEKVVRKPLIDYIDENLA